MPNLNSINNNNAAYHLPPLQPPQLASATTATLPPLLPPPVSSSPLSNFDLISSSAAAASSTLPASLDSIHQQQQHQNFLQQQQQQFRNSFPNLATPKETVPPGNAKPPPKSSICILTPCSNSHPFDERRIAVTRTEESAVKIGRSVVRLQPSPNNAIFDCKVLSRNHAILWQNSEGHFLIKDTRSSNGTFINNERLSASGEESEPRELFSGDILQLGVEIVDNAKKVASGCITCIVRLLNERGEEYPGRTQTDQYTFPICNQQQVPLNYTLVRNDKFFILDQYIKEAKFRENLLGQKLQSLEEQLISAQEALHAKWNEHINQEVLLSRIESLESQLSAYASRKTSTSAAASGTSEEQRMKQEIQDLMEDRAKAEQMAKEMLKTKCEQMEETRMRLHDAEVGLVNVEEECAFLRQRRSDVEDQLTTQRNDYDALLTKYNEVCNQLCAAEKAAANSTAAAATIASPQQQQQSPQLNGGSVQQQNNMSMEEVININIVCNNNTKVDQNAVGGDINWIEVPPAVKKEPEDTGDSEATAAQQQSKELELRKALAECEAELERQRSMNTELMEMRNVLPNSSMSVLPPAVVDEAHLQATSAQNFQVFLVSAFPFLLIIFLLLSPFYRYLGSSESTTEITIATDNNNQQPEVVNASGDGGEEEPNSGGRSKDD